MKHISFGNTVSFAIAAFGILGRRCMRKLLLAAILVMGGGVCATPSYAVSPYQVFDGTGKLVGQLIGNDAVALKINGILTAVGIGREGFFAIESINGFLYTTSDCKGQAYFDANGLPLTTFSAFDSKTQMTTNYVPETLKTRTFLSESTPTNCLNASNTKGLFPFSDYSGRAVTIDFDSLGFKPPFTVK